MKSNFFTKQTPIKFIGTARQLFGGAMTWTNVAILFFTAVTFWNTNTMTEIRYFIPVLNEPILGLLIFITTIICGIVLVMWLEHKFVQPAIMNYWNKMFYEQNNPMTKHLERVEEKIDKIIAENNKQS